MSVKPLAPDFSPFPQPQDGTKPHPLTQLTSDLTDFSSMSGLPKIDSLPTFFSDLLAVPKLSAVPPGLDNVRLQRFSPDRPRLTGVAEAYLFGGRQPPQEVRVIIEDRRQPIDWGTAPLRPPNLTVVPPISLEDAIRQSAFSPFGFR